MGKDDSECRIHLSNSLFAKMVETKEGHADWKDPIDTQVFCELCATLVLHGNRKGLYLRAEGCEEFRKGLMPFKGVVTNLQLNNKWDHLRKTWKQLLECETGYLL